MDENATTAIVIATAIFVSVVVLSLILASFNEMYEIYSLVGQTNLDISAGYIENYHGKELDGMDLLNTLKKVEEEDEVVVVVDYPGKSALVSSAVASGKREAEMMRELLKNGGSQYNYSNKYDVRVIDDNGTITIKFFDAE